MGLRFSNKANSTFYHNVLLEASAASGGKFNVFTHDTMPRRFHFAGNERIAPIYVVPKVGYALTDRIENGTGMSKGVSGLGVLVLQQQLANCHEIEPRVR